MAVPPPVPAVVSEAVSAARAAVCSVVAAVSVEVLATAEESVIVDVDSWDTSCDAFADGTNQRAASMVPAAVAVSNDDAIAVAYGTARSERPVQQGYAAVLEVFIISFVTSTMSALTILVTDVWRSGLTSTAAVAAAFNQAVPVVGGWVVAFCSFMFGYTTLIGWAYYGEQFLEYILGPRIVTPETKAEMKRVLHDIQSGKFTRDWMLENKVGQASFKAMRRSSAEHPIEKVGGQLRAMMPWIGKNALVDKAKN